MTRTATRTRGVPAALSALARERRVALGYTDAFGRRRRTSLPTLLALLRALGEPVDRPEDAVEALRHRRSRGASPGIFVAWDGVLPPAFPKDLAIELEAGGTVPAPSLSPLPPGVHRAVVEAGGGGVAAHVIAAPRRPAPWPGGAWGLFAPTYAVDDGRDRPRGDLTSLEAFGRLTGSLGGRYVATLPLLARRRPPANAAAPVPASSPYSPISRMWWDEDLLDLDRLPELAGDPRLRPSPPAPGTPAWRELLADGAARLREHGSGPRATAFGRYLDDRPDVMRYGGYRGSEERGTRPPATVPATDATALCHAYAQWATDAQLAEVAQGVAAGGAGLLLDLPVGCDPAGYDPWAHPGTFAAGATIGAPPDRFFLAGQDWGLAPPRPDADRAAGYPVLRSVLAHGLRHAAALRVDHVMGFERLWWIPDGAPAAEGAYVGYAAEEMLSIALLEAARAGACIVGEDLGTVTPALRRLLAAHHVAGTDVAVFAMEDRPAAAPAPRRGAVAMVDTHDTATFAGWLAGDDVVLRRDLGLLAPDAAAAALRRRRADVAKVVARLRAAGSVAGDPTVGDLLAAVLEELGRSDAGVVVVTLEDLWGERDPQNVPGTLTEHANFTRRLARSLDQVSTDRDVRAVLDRLDRARRAAPERRDAP